jgi:hypothetical protein
MADQTFTERPGSTGNSVEGANRTARGATDQLLSAGRDLKDKASDFASSSSDTMKEKASDFADAAKDAGSQAADRFKEMVESQKDAGARYVGGIAEAMRRAAREFEHDLPIAGTVLRKGASQVDAVSGSVRHGDFNDLLNEAHDFARRQPAAFLGMTVLAGFGIVRFLKSSSRASSEREPDRYSPTRDPDGSSFGAQTGTNERVSEDMTERVAEELKR